MAQVSSARQRDHNGYLTVRGCPLSSFGVFEYSAGQVGMKDGDPNRIVKVYRPEAEVSNPALIESLKNVPFIDDHEMLSGFDGDESATPPEEYGIDGVLTGAVWYDSPWLRGDLRIFTRKLQDELANGKKDLSIGYTCDFDLNPGVFNGQPYEVVQSNMRGNHIALVDMGRIPGARVLDGRHFLCFDHLDFRAVGNTPGVNSRGASTMKKVKTIDSDVVANLQSQLKALLPTFEQFLNEEAAEPAHQEGMPNAGAAQEAAAEPSATVPPTPQAAPVQQPTAVVEQAPAAVPAAPADPAAAAGGMTLQEAIAKLTAILTQLQAAVSGGEAGGAEVPEAGGGEEGEGDEGGGEGGGGEEGEGTTNEETEDEVEGLEGTVQGDEDIQEGGQGEASPGPAAGEHSSAQDAALSRFYADNALKARTYDRLSKVIGAFDHASMDSKAVAAYGVKKLSLKVAKGQEQIALDAYLAGAEAARKAANDSAQKQRVTGDAAVAATSPVLDAYLAGE